ncbi:E3 ubiquitin-protein ligase RFWD3 [Elysia marginata]|uniref:E3 ubiquitin-protein ligase RFWD3 n=1 Tax=Elysia marginata TaxID=1093978 RepID=A0AAV4HRC3_9GAST|nr:E3 ubiquitin-protein ligase RFWD3 [Elysia marginata]
MTSQQQEVYERNDIARFQEYTANFLDEVKWSIMGFVDRNEEDAVPQSTICVTFTKLMLMNMVPGRSDMFDVISSHPYVIECGSKEALNVTAICTSHVVNDIHEDAILVKCGTFMECCNDEYSDETEYPVMSDAFRQLMEISLVLDYDVKLLATIHELVGNDPVNVDRIDAKVQMFYGQSSTRCFVTMEYIKRRLDEQIIDVVMHNSNIISVLYNLDCPTPLTMKDILGDDLFHDDTLEILTISSSPFNSWTIPRSYRSASFLDKSRISALQCVEFGSETRRYIANLVAVAMYFKEHMGRKSAVMINRTMCFDFWSCTIGGAIEPTMNDATVFGKLSKYGFDIPVSLAFNAFNTEQGYKIVNPLTNDPYNSDYDPCVAVPVKRFLENMRRFFNDAPLNEFGLEGNKVVHFGDFMVKALLTDDVPLKSKLEELNERLMSPPLPNSRVCISNSECSVCLEPLITGGDHRPCSLTCGHIFGYSCAKRMRTCAICRANVTDVRPLYMNCFNFENANNN